MAIDPSIPLQVKKPEFMSPAQAVQLQSLVQDQTLRRLQIAQTQKAFAEDQALRQIFANPDSVDQNTGQLKPTALATLAKVNPEYYRKYQGVMLDALTKQATLQAAQRAIDADAQKGRDRGKTIADEARRYAVNIVQADVDAKAHPEVINSNYRKAVREWYDKEKEAGRITPQEWESGTKTPDDYVQGKAAIETPEQRAAAEREKRIEAQQAFERDMAKKRLAISQSELDLSKQRERRVAEAQKGSQLTAEQERLTGEDFLATMPPDRAELIRGVAQGRIPPNAIGYRGAQREQLMREVVHYKPDYNAQEFPTSMAVRKDFAAGTTSRNITALNTALGHMNTLADLGEALKNNDLKRVNQLVNQIKTETSNPSITNYQMAQGAVANELMRVFRQVGASQQEVEDWEKKLSASQGPDALRGTLETGAKLLYSRLNALNRQWERGTGEKEYPKMLSPEAEKAMKRFGISPSGDQYPSLPGRVSEYEPGTVYQTPQGPAEFTGRFDNGKPVFKRPSLPRVKSTEEGKALGPGAHFIGPDGEEYWNK